MTWLPLLVLHALSYGFSTLEVGEREVDVHLRLQMLSLVEVFPDLDPDLDGDIDAELLESRADDIASYVRTHWRLSFGDRGASSFELRSLRIGEREDHIVLGNMGWVEVEFTLGSAHRIDRLQLEVDLFESTSPGHSEIVHVYRADAPEPDVRAVAGVLAEPVGWTRPSGPLERWRGAAREALGSADVIFLGPAVLALISLGAHRIRDLLRAAGGLFLAQGILVVSGATLFAGLRLEAKDFELLAPLAVVYLGISAYMTRPPGSYLGLRSLAFGIPVALAWVLEEANGQGREPDPWIRAGHQTPGWGLQLLVVAIAFALLRARTPHPPQPPPVVEPGTPRDQPPTPCLADSSWARGGSLLVAALALALFGLRFLTPAP